MALLEVFRSATSVLLVVTSISLKLKCPAAASGIQRWTVVGGDVSMQVPEAPAGVSANTRRLAASLWMSTCGLQGGVWEVAIASHCVLARVFLCVCVFPPFSSSSLNHALQS